VKVKEFKNSKKSLKLGSRPLSDSSTPNPNKEMKVWNLDPKRNFNSGNKECKPSPTGPNS
jgi:hypothetical protein